MPYIESPEEQLQIAAGSNEFPARPVQRSENACHSGDSDFAAWREEARPKGLDVARDEDRIGFLRPADETLAYIIDNEAIEPPNRKGMDHDDETSHHR